jgi:hypothetical protein
VAKSFKKPHTHCRSDVAVAQARVEEVGSERIAATERGSGRDEIVHADKLRRRQRQVKGPRGSVDNLRDRLTCGKPESP